MKYYVGLDVSLKEVCVCVVDLDGSVVAEGKVATDSSEILPWIERRVGAVDRIVHESGPFSIWPTRELARRGAPMACFDARDSDLARRPMSVPGVGPIVALNFIATVDDARRFSRVSDVGAYLGLTPRRYQSGEFDYLGRIFKRGNGVMRALLFEATR